MGQSIIRRQIMTQAAGDVSGVQCQNRKSNVPAIVSLVLGLLGCVPAITSLGAIVFGAIGIKTAKKINGNGKGMAIAGLILGMIGLLAWGYAGYRVYVIGRDVVDTVQTAWNDKAAFLSNSLAKNFITGLSSKNNNALKEVVSSDSKTDLNQLRNQIGNLGTFQNVSGIQWSIAQKNGMTSVTISGAANFANGSKNFTATVVKEGNTFKISNFVIE
jgi:hypothetical protein